MKIEALVNDIVVASKAVSRLRDEIEVLKGTPAREGMEALAASFAASGIANKIALDIVVNALENDNDVFLELAHERNRLDAYLDELAKEYAELKAKSE